MDAKIKRAYQHLLYQAMLDIRSHHPISPYAQVPWWNPFVWARIVKRLRYAMEVADWMHNLAQHSELDILDLFNEERFWKEFEQLNYRYPEQRMQNYRSWFASSMCSKD